MGEAERFGQPVRPLPVASLFIRFSCTA